MGDWSEQLSASRAGPALLDRLPPLSRNHPRYERAALALGMAHIGVGAFHRCHQAEYTDDCLDARSAAGAWSASTPRRRAWRTRWAGRAGSIRA